jgi:rhomboid protease GluP
LLQLASQPLLEFDLPLVLFAKINDYIRAGQIWRLITPILVHGSIMHIASNMYALFILGSDVESVMGYKRFLLLYLLAGFSGNVLSFLLSGNVSVGASTSIFGLIAAQGIFLYQNRALLPNATNALGRLASVLVINLVISLSPGIDLWGHLGGLFGGAIFAWLAGPRWVLEGLYPTLQVVDQHQGQHVVTGAAAVLLVFGTLAFLGMGIL